MILELKIDFDTSRYTKQWQFWESTTNTRRTEPCRSVREADDDFIEIELGLIVYSGGSFFGQQTKEGPSHLIINLTRVNLEHRSKRRISNMSESSVAGGCQKLKTLVVRGLT